jgi:hypothetical protein
LEIKTSYFFHLASPISSMNKRAAIDIFEGPSADAMLEDPAQYDGSPAQWQDGADTKRHACAAIPLRIDSLCRKLCGGCLQLLPLNSGELQMQCAACGNHFASCNNWLNECGFRLNGLRVCRWCSADKDVTAFDYASERFIEATRMVTDFYPNAVEAYHAWFQLTYKTTLADFCVQLLYRAKQPSGSAEAQAEQRRETGDRTFRTRQWLHHYCVGLVRAQLPNPRVMCAAAAITRSAAAAAAAAEETLAE